MRRTYGIGGYVLFDEKKHKDSKKVVNGSRVLCKDVFDAWVKTGEEIEYEKKLLKNIL